MSTLCPKCQQAVGQQARFCGYCGEPLDGMATAQSSQASLGAPAPQPIFHRLKEDQRDWDAPTWRIASGLMAVVAGAALWLGRDSISVWLLCIPVIAGGLIHALQMPSVGGWLDRLGSWLDHSYQTLRGSDGWRKAAWQPVRFLHWVWNRTRSWSSPHASAGVRAAGLLLAIGLSALGVFIAATLAFFTVLLVVGFIIAALIFILVWSLPLPFTSEHGAGSASQGQSSSSTRSEPDLEEVIEKLKSGSYRIEDDGAIVSTGLFSGPTGYKIDLSTGDILKTGGLFSESTGYQIDLDSGDIVKKGWLTDDSTGYRIDQDSGQVVKREWLTDSPTGLRIDRRSGKIEKEGCFLTSACLRARGLPDNCAELQELRAFRDEYVRKRVDGEEILMEYYRLAPQVVSCIDRSCKSKHIYEDLYRRFVERSLELIRAGRNEEALCYYRSEFEKLRSELRLNY